ncbi:DUF305 domain-containing protein [Streptomyces gardneri]|uniref:DUF305 domain-containing protein n=1 Tax=Streptomyces gardneri TaxID=66892 RepID=UPI0006BC5419|nr:DUF305 domain-containing protein [Streptomyces gardneri]QPK49442.1 DUF305 domain-containing protein [Streptomyces gardneri]WRK40976.1 DUF305 domain-containing protein [Streptomyces venezuelae]CUM36639.1 Multicopper oxidase [Streptomyces venezuelae]
MRTFTRATAKKFALAGAVTATGLLLAACGTEDGGMSGMDHGGKSTTASATATASASASADASAEAAAPGAFNDADVMFAQMMIPHHEQALEMAKLADGRAQDPEVRKLVAAIEQAQDPEIRKMKAWLKGWGKPASAGAGHGMAGMMSAQDMKDLAAVKGEAFDRKFAELMIAHHDGAVAMAKDEQKNGRNASAKKLADDVVRTQSTEIAELRKILDRL